MNSLQSAKSKFDTVAEGRRQWAKHNGDDAATALASITSTVRLAHHFISGGEQVLEPFGITFAQFELLTLLSYARRGYLPMHSLATRLQVPPPSLTHTVRKLEHEGLLERAQDPQDKRSYLVSLTDQGTVLLSTATQAFNSFLLSIELTPEEQETIISTSARLRGF